MLNSVGYRGEKALLTGNRNGYYYTGNAIAWDNSTHWVLQEVASTMVANAGRLLYAANMLC